MLQDVPVNRLLEKEIKTKKKRWKRSTGMKSHKLNSSKRCDEKA